MCEEEELPVEIQPVAHRATKRRKGDEVSVGELRMMHRNAIAVEDAETLEYVAQHLKRRSRRGGAATPDCCQFWPVVSSDEVINNFCEQAVPCSTRSSKCTSIQMR